MSDKTRTRKKSKGKRKPARTSRRTAATSDRYELYELSVQGPEAEVDFIDRAWQQRRGRLAHSVREDFCGTAIAAVEWVKRRRDNTAVCVDIDQAVLDWAEARLPDRLDPDQARRFRLLQGDVRTVRTKPVDCVLAMNFSYYIFKTREGLGDYFKRVRRALVADGLFLLDAYGGSDSFVEMEERRKIDGFTYVWDQHAYNPINGDALNFIHYEFPDGSRMSKAFAYEWRLWTLPEIQELLYEAGFSKVTVYWEGTDEDGEGNDEFDPATVGEACPGWIAYLVAEK
jgi:SAM-dependent methyltransferase